MKNFYIDSKLNNVVMETIFKSVQSAKCLSVLQFEYGNVNSLDYISGNRAINEGIIHISEISDSGKVNSLKITNSSRSYVFFSDGDILEGGKQNRLLNTSVFIGPNSITIIPVSCVERGRWNYSRRNFKPSDFYAPSLLRKVKNIDVQRSLRNDKSFSSKQSKVWEEIQYRQTDHNKHSKTSDLINLFTDMPVDFDKFVNRFKVTEKANGAAIFFKNNLISLDIYNRTDIYKEYFNKLITSSAIEIYRMNLECKPDETALLNKTEIFLDEFENNPKNINEPIGEGIDLRLQTGNIIGSSLQYNSEIVHLNISELKNPVI